MTAGILRIVGGSLRNRRLRVLPGSRPTSERAREALFDILGPWIERRSVLELYAGSGAVAFEALSRGAAAAAAVDEDVRALEENRRRLGVDLEIVRGPASLAAARLRAEGRRFDLIFADPPYDDADLSALEAAGGLLAPGSQFVLQTDARRACAAPAGLVRTRVAAYGRNVLSFYAAPAGEGNPA